MADQFTEPGLEVIDPFNRPSRFDPLRFGGNTLMNIGRSLWQLPGRAMGAARNLQSLGEATYDPAPAVDAALMTMGGTAFGAPRGAMGAGPAMARKPPVHFDDHGGIWLFSAEHRNYLPWNPADAIYTPQFQTFVADAVAKAPGRRTPAERQALDMAMGSSRTPGPGGPMTDK